MREEKVRGQARGEKASREDRQNEKKRKSKQE